MASERRCLRCGEAYVDRICRCGCMNCGYPVFRSDCHAEWCGTVGLVRRKAVAKPVEEPTATIEEWVRRSLAQRRSA